MKTEWRIKKDGGLEVAPCKGEHVDLEDEFQCVPGRAKAYIPPASVYQALGAYGFSEREHNLLRAGGVIRREISPNDFRMLLSMDP